MTEMICEIYTAVFTIEDKREFLNEVRRIASDYRTHIILFDAGRLAGREHVKTALRHAWRAWSRGEGISNSFEMEALLYAAGTRQCHLAGSCGVHTGENRAYLAICPPAPGVRERLADLVEFVDTDLEEISPEKRESLAEHFGITPAEVAVVGEERFRELVLERVALLEVYR
ncbi:KEOPS complex subunit Cgi121 [Methanoculleus sp.]|jgi:KEOPS complex subunit Cgi121|uniref:KEOPS complex subunit Cgi121 n=1 Tax=Methanoculleus sp. TaxID=90427 RepID=UPI002626C749|nr:KEOPS complex subunit Cgi121 [Methanoculleus sp.]MDI6866988.1 KEOPS complex subunit Cgi121 [Methanoculleus sp.]